jgi:hypothetical protein
VVRVRRRLALSLTAITQLVIDHSDNRSLWPLAHLGQRIIPLYSKPGYGVAHVLV